MLLQYFRKVIIRKHVSVSKIRYWMHSEISWKALKDYCKVKLHIRLLNNAHIFDFSHILNNYNMEMPFFNMFKRFCEASSIALMFNIVEMIKKQMFSLLCWIYLIVNQLKYQSKPIGMKRIEMKERICAITPIPYNHIHNLLLFFE